MPRTLDLQPRVPRFHDRLLSCSPPAIRRRAAGWCRIRSAPAATRHRLAGRTTTLRAESGTDSVQTSGYARWFRASTPYISAHRNRTFVVLLGGEAIAHNNLPNIVHDLALLQVLGVRLVLVHGARPQIDAALPDC